MKASILFDWVIQSYKDKGAGWIVSSKNFNNLNQNNLLFIPVDDMDSFFDIKAVLRRKKSGSRDLSEKLKEDFIHEIQQVLLENDFNISKESKKFILKTKFAMNNLNIGSNYYLTPIDNINSKYRVKIKGTTNNPNIMFEINLKSTIFKKDEFIEYLDL